MVDETEFLNAEEDRYADRTVEICGECNLPRTVVTYELGFQILRKQISDLKAELLQIVNKIDAIEHK